MDSKIKSALQACIRHYHSGASAENGGTTRSGAFAEALVSVFETDQLYLDKVTALDTLIDDHPDFEELREILFDLLMLNFFASDVTRLESDYLDSAEWASIEEQTIDRGTELLNLLLYLEECADEDIEPDLDDYLREFLLVDEDEFQDEHRIYEPVLSRQILVESSYGEIAQASGGLPPDSELFELFYPLMSFFFEPAPKPEDLEEFMESAPNPAFDTAIYQLIIHYNH